MEGKGGSVKKGGSPMSEYCGFRMETERLILKVVDESYAAPILDYYSRNRDFINQWEPARPARFYTLAYQREVLRAELGRMEEDSLAKFWIFKKDAPLRPIGAVALNNIVRGSFLSCHLGYKLDKDEVNKGYMTEAVQAMVVYAFDVLRLHRIEANIIPTNSPSLQVVTKLGFYYEGTAKKYLKINGIWHDHVHMVLLNEALEADEGN
jgi:ribosomal-protein-alanine N-acetyltransferase